MSDEERSAKDAFGQPVGRGDRIRFIDWACGCVSRSLIGKTARVVRVGENGGLCVRRKEWRKARWVPVDVVRRCVMREEGAE